MDEIFTEINEALQQESTLRDEIKEITQKIDPVVRLIQRYAAQIHADHKNGLIYCEKVREQFPVLKELFKSLQDIVKEDSYYKFISLWKNLVQHLVSSIAFVNWIETKKLISLKELEDIFGFPGKSKGPSSWALELEDYLYGICFLPSELSRLCVNAVIAEDYDLPKEIQIFVSELFSGYQLLNLKNDSLRRKFDSMKYDMKKIEEIEYDINIRNLRSSNK